MANRILTDDIITRKALEIFENELVLTRTINRQYDDSFARDGAKIGDSLRIRKPTRYVTKSGATFQAQDTVEQFVPLAITEQDHIGLNFTSAELTLDVDDFGDRVLKPAMSQLAATVDAKTAAYAYKHIYQAVGTPGTPPATSLVLLQAQQKLDEAAAPRSPRYLTVDPAGNASLVEGLKGFFNPTDVISRQFKTGLITEDVLGYTEIGMSQSIAKHITGTRAATGATLTAGVAEGASVVNITGTANQIITEGDIFTIAGIFSVNPQTRQTTGSLQQFVVTAVNVASGAGAYTNVQISPAIYSQTQQYATVTTLPVGGEAIVFMGAPVTPYAQNLVYCKDAITLATADLILPRGVDMAARAVHNGISLRLVKQFDINNDRMPCRIDVLYGYSVIRPEGAVRMFG